MDYVNGDMMVVVSKIYVHSREINIILFLRNYNLSAKKWITMTTMKQQKMPSIVKTWSGINCDLLY